MKKYKRKTIEDLYRVTGKYWKTSDADYLDTITHLSQKIDDRLWCEISSLADFAVHKHASINTLVEALRLFGYEGEKDERVSG